MTLFLVVAAGMAVIAAAAVAFPLFRDRRSRLAGAAAAICVVGGSAALYPLWSNWDWHGVAAPQAAAPDVLAMVGKLEKHLRDDPGDGTGWLMLGRSYLALERLDDAIMAYDHAQRLDADSPEAALGMGEALSLRAGGNIPPAAAQQFERALTLAPDNPKALLYGGFAAAGRGDNALAAQRWRALKDLHPPRQIEDLLDARIAELDPVAGTKPPGPSGASGLAVAGAAAPGATTAQAARATINLSIAPALQSRVAASTPLFVFAQDPGSPGPPLAVKRLTAAAIGSRIDLSAADSMVPGRALADGKRVAITARISFAGQPLAAAGDLYGELTYDVGHDGIRDLIIDRVAP